MDNILKPNDIISILSRKTGTNCEVEVDNRGIIIRVQEMQILIKCLPSVESITIVPETEEVTVTRENEWIHTD